MSSRVGLGGWTSLGDVAFLMGGGRTVPKDPAAPLLKVPLPVGVRVDT